MGALVLENLKVEPPRPLGLGSLGTCLALGLAIDQARKLHLLISPQKYSLPGMQDAEDGDLSQEAVCCSRGFISTLVTRETVLKISTDAEKIPGQI